MNATFVELPEIIDERGSLCFAESEHLPFQLNRVFWIYGVPEGQTRGGHAHGTCAELIFPVRGFFDIMVDDGHSITTYHMDNPHRGILIPPYVWCELSGFSPDACCLVFASQEYNADGYINNYDDFKRIKTNDVQ